MRPLLAAALLVVVVSGGFLCGVIRALTDEEWP
jgi:hypothetical protein